MHAAPDPTGPLPKTAAALRALLLAAQAERDGARAQRDSVAAERDRQALINGGDAPERIVTTGYVKAAFRQRTPAARLFADPRPVILYTPHWQAHRSSWWRWGPEVVERILADGRYNLILQGVALFRVVRELDVATAFRQVEAELLPVAGDEALSIARRASLEVESRAFADAQGYAVDWDQVGRLDDESLVNGIAQIAPFDAATNAAAQEAARLTREGKLISVAGGGDTVAALNKAGVAGDFTFISTAGGAFLEWMEGKVLPGVAALERR